MNYRDRIIINPEIRFGGPCVRGTRITVGDVLSDLASGMSEQEIRADFPQLTVDDIGACLAFVAERERRILSIPAIRSRMLLFDENLAGRLVAGPPSSIQIVRTSTIGAWPLIRILIWRYARFHGLAIVTKDEDFQQRSVLYSAPPQGDLDPVGKLLDTGRHRSASSASQ